MRDPEDKIPYDELVRENWFETQAQGEGLEFMKALRCAALAVGLVIAVGGTAYADISPSAPTITPVGSNFRWSYTLSTNASELISTGLNSSFFTLYDIDGLVGSATYTPLIGTLIGVATDPALGQTPVGIVPTDSPAIPNASVAFSGTALPSTTIGILSFVDTMGTLSATPSGQFAAQGTLLADLSRSFNSSFVNVPAAPTPEPGSLVLLSSGVLGMLGIGLRRFRSR